MQNWFDIFESGFFYRSEQTKIELQVFWLLGFVAIKRVKKGPKVGQKFVFQTGWFLHISDEFLLLWMTYLKIIHSIFDFYNSASSTSSSPHWLRNRSSPIECIWFLYRIRGQNRSYTISKCPLSKNFEEFQFSGESGLYTLMDHGRRSIFPESSLNIDLSDLIFIHVF